MPVSAILMKEDDAAKQLADLQLCDYENAEDWKTNNTSKLISHHCGAHANDDIAVDFKPCNYPERVCDVMSTVVLNCAYSLDKFYIIPTDTFEQLDSLTEKLQQLYNTDDEPGMPSFTAVAQPCVARYSEDMTWYRALITDVRGDEITVLFVDFGISEVTTSSCLRPLKSELLEIPPFAIECCLFGVKLIPENHDKIREKLSYLIENDVEFEMEIVEGHQPCKVKLKGERDLVEELVDEGLVQYLYVEPGVVDSGQFEEGNFEVSSTPAVILGKEQGPIETAFYDAQAQTEYEALMGSLGHQNQPCVTFTENIEEHVGTEKYPKITVSNKCLVKLGYVYSSDKFFVIPVELQEQFSYITSVLKEQYDLPCELDEQPLCTPHIMQPCVARHVEHMAWYRAIITDIKDDDVLVFFVDLGSVAIVKRSGLRMISPELLKIAPIAVECSLFGIRVMPGKQEEVNSRLISMSESKLVLEMEVTESHELPYKIKLKSRFDICEQFVNEELCEFYVTPSQKLRDNETFNENLGVAFLEKPSSLEDNKGIIPQQNISHGSMSVSIKYVDVSGDAIVLHVVPYSLKGALINLQAKLQAIYCNSTCSSLESGSKFCAAKSSDDGSWYRAQLLAEMEDGCNVKYVDYGNCEIVPFSDLRVLLPEFISEVQCSFACCLSGVKVIPGKEESIQEKIYDLISETETTIEIYDVALSTLHMCKEALKVDIDSSDINHILIEDGLVSQVYPACY